MVIEELEQVMGSNELISRQRSHRLSESGEGDHSSVPLLARQTSTVSQESGERSSPARKGSKVLENSTLGGKKPPADKNKLIEVEKTETGSVQFSVYVYYLRAVGWAMALITVLLNLMFQGIHSTECYANLKMLVTFAYFGISQHFPWARIYGCPYGPMQIAGIQRRLIARGICTLGFTGHWVQLKVSSPTGFFRNFRNNA